MTGVNLRAGKRCRVSGHGACLLPGRGQGGFTLIAVLAAMFILAIGTQAVMTYVSQQAHREREQELLRIGSTFAQAIGAYYEATPGQVKRWPQKLEDLLEDKRLVSFARYVREIYPDPITRSTQWGIVVAADGGIAGVYSLSNAAPLQTMPVTLGTVSLSAATRYADWHFVYQPRPAAGLPRS